MNTSELSRIQADDNNNNEQALVCTSVRFTKGVIEVIDDIATNNSCSRAEIIRFCVDNRLEKYLTNVLLVEPEQGREIRELLHNTLVELGNIRAEINRIGVNYNQEIRLKNLEQKFKAETSCYALGTARQYEASKKYVADKEEVLSGSTAFKTEDFKQLMNELNESLEKVGEKLCLILG